MDDCPAESGDFRAQQCSAHNDIKYQGMTYEWVPAPYDPSDPCALRCQAKGRSLTVELAPKVLDGTRCRADALDMCISGVCQAAAPGSDSINRLLHVSEFVPGPWSSCSTTCGPGRQNREVKCQVLLSFTKTEVDLPEEECGEDRPSVERPCSRGPCGPVADLEQRGAAFSTTKESYVWDYRGFAACSATCAAGKQTAVVRCVQTKQGDEVDDSLCDPSSRPSTMVRICNPEPCPPR
ncbi:ADAMTS-like protein 3 [Salarias fasciatus]|uniref:ADAMTS-like protein 3 n=1 Tax=Salarias fasciatus TaxID=181472 RepID=UPI001176A59E|nr:ADAMTS-like protein 3 [Salarias fasciatus]